MDTIALIESESLKNGIANSKHTRKQSEDSNQLEDTVASTECYPCLAKFQYILSSLGRLRGSKHENLDDDLISSQHILNYHRHLEKQKPNHNTEYKRRINDRQNHIPQQTTGAPMHKWPTFDTNDGTTRGSIENGYTQKSVTEKQAYQKNFAYHKVTGKPAHLKKNPIAYIAVSAISPKPSDSEEDIMLETELHRLKPWRNKRTPQKV
ncbi:hypothetical protein GWI33_001177 [Rhynchophorus ferrugineus]|uniref:Uncharacterized protein n=1 Tax=Rhynchophorus ferrugineus TaxID=354439 RepID=A0A834ISL2_RHYFE|nr:hypothetical protein GWI33_001177 [Rhynchophorus ferrugineus]